MAGRQDGAKLLENCIEAIDHDLLSSRLPHIQGGEVIILGRLKPPPPEVAHFLLTFVSQRDRDPNARAELFSSFFVRGHKTRNLLLRSIKRNGRGERI